jgi:NADH-quinone oxidoreductase subunit N
MKNPDIDFLAIAPEIVLVATILAVLIVDLIAPARSRWYSSRIAAIGSLGALVPVAFLARDGVDRVMFDGAYVVDNYALALKAMFFVVAYVTILLSIDYIADGDYYQSEFYFLLLCSVLGMSVMTSSRDLITIFVALETISIPTYVLAGFRKHDPRSNEAGIKYYLIGAISSAVMLYGMSLIFGLTGSTTLAGIAEAVRDTGDTHPLLIVAIFLTLVGFAFKVSAVPFHWWAPDTYEGAPTPVTAFLSVASKAGGFVAMLNIIFFGFATNTDAWWPVVWVMAAGSMILGNVSALRQTNIVRMLAYSSVAQGGFMLVPFAAFGIAGTDSSARQSAFSATIIYLLVYAVMNLGAFAVVIAVARRTRSGEISSYAGLFQTSPALAVLMTAFMASLAGIPPLAGWWAKFVMFRAAVDAGSSAAIVLAIIAAVMSVVAFFYYSSVIRAMWFMDPAEGESAPIRIPPALNTAIVVTGVLTLAVGVYPQLFGKIGDLAAQVIA